MKSNKRKVQKENLKIKIKKTKENLNERSSKSLPNLKKKSEVTKPNKNSKKSDNLQNPSSRICKTTKKKIKKKRFEFLNQNLPDPKSQSRRN